MNKLLLFCFVIGNLVHAQNAAPYTIGPKSLQTLPGQNTCLNIQTADDDPADTVRISWNSTVQSATFNSNNGFVQHASGEICWTPTTSDPRSEPYLFFITLDDGHVQVTDTFSFMVGGIPERDSFHYTKGACGERMFYSTFNEWVDAVSYQFSDSTTFTFNSPVTEISLQGLDPGTYVLKTSVMSNTPAYKNYFDTILITEGINVTSKFEILSEPNQYRITLTENYGNPTASYFWTAENSLGLTVLPDTLPEITIQVWETTDLCAIVSSDQNCTDTSCFTLPVNPNNVLEIEKQARIYPNPCVDQLHIESHKPILSLTILDIQGKPVLQKEEANTLTSQLEVSELPKGTYLLAILYSDHSVRRHVVVVR